MPAFLHVGEVVESWLAPDASTHLQCPSCGHYTPVARAQIVPDRASSQCDWVDCACVRGEGLPRTGANPVSDCPCVARYRLRPSGITGRYQIAAVDLDTMSARLVEREAGAALTSDVLFAVDYVLDDVVVPVMVHIPSVKPPARKRKAARS